MTTSHAIDLSKHSWNEFILEASPSHGLLMIMAFDRFDHPHMIGTGFVVSVNTVKRQAICITAAHVFSEIQRLQSPADRSHHSTPYEFRTLPKPIDLSGNRVQVIGLGDGGTAEAAAIIWAQINEKTDIAVFSIPTSKPGNPPFFDHLFQLDDAPPRVGEVLAVYSFAEMAIDKFQQHSESSSSFAISRRPMMRVGTVKNYHPNGLGLCGGPCIETTIPVFPGMSGGPVFRYVPDTLPAALGLVCYDLDSIDQNKNNRSLEGHSVFAKLPVHFTSDQLGNRNPRLDLGECIPAGSPPSA